MFPPPKVVVAALIASSAPLLLLLSNGDWFFTREGYLDPWNYVGLFHQYLDPDYLPEEYKLARLPWILSGLLVTQLLSPVTASYVLHAVFLCAASAALFVTVQVLFSRPALSAVVATCLGFYTHGHGSGGWDYHNTASGAFYLAAFAMSVLPSAIQGRGVALLALGSMAALTVHTNVTFLNLMPALAYVHLCVVHTRSGSLPPSGRLLLRGMWILLGALVATVLLGLVNWMVGREAIFFSRLVDLVALYMTDADFQAGRPLSSTDWVLMARHLAFPAAIFVAGAASLVLHRRRPADQRESVSSALVVQLLAMVLLWAAWQSAGHTALDWDYMAYALIPSAFIALAGILSRGWPDWCERHWLVTVLGSAAVLTLCLILEYIPGAQRFGTSIQSFILVAGGLILLVPLALYHRRPSVVSAALVVVAFAFGNRVVAPGYPDYFITDRCKIQPAVYGAIVDAASWVMTIDPLYTRARTWFDEAELLEPLEGCRVRLGHMANSITTMASVPYVARAFPLGGIEELPHEAVSALMSENLILVIISNTPAHLDAWGRRLAAMGLGHTEIAMHRVPVLASGFAMHAWSVGPDSR